MNEIERIKARLDKLLSECPDPHFALLVKREIDALMALVHRP